MTTSTLTDTPEGSVYEVFARFREKRLKHIGSVVAKDDELAKMYAATLYNEWKWQEMAIVKRTDVVTVIAPV
ncbi:MAG: hypothetical protein KC423_25610 [Anaerolineales bacterium]|nr:hypothetical protein [Anaerolineales bacterium]